MVDTDYAPATAPKNRKCVYVGHDEPYQRTAIFPWGGGKPDLLFYMPKPPIPPSRRHFSNSRGKQKGPNGEKVVSARAIRHTMELAAVAKEAKSKVKPSYEAALLFVVVRTRNPPPSSYFKTGASLSVPLSLSSLHLPRLGSRWRRSCDTKLGPRARSRINFDGFSALRRGICHSLHEES